MHAHPGRTLLVLSLAATLPLAAVPQASLPQSQAPPPPTLQVTSRAVLTDVVVTDRRGNSIHGLPQSVFHISDNNRPQRLKSFEEHSGAPQVEQAAAALPAGTVTNTAQVNGPAVANVMLIDTTNMEIVDQMYLYQRLTHFIQNLPAGVPMAIFLRAFDFSVMLQNFTANHDLLQAALRKAIPHPQLASGIEAHELAGLVQVAGYLSQMPGRKNLLWFNGGSTEFTHPGPWSNLSQTGAASNTDGSVGTNTDSPGFFPTDPTRMFYDLLESARIALYPVDVRGPTAQMTGALDEQHLDAIGFADATGGQAFYNENDMAVVARQAMENGDNYYTLSYSPNDLRGNGSWHSVRVTVDGGPYTLSYRRGYFDDGPGATKALSAGLLKVGGQEIEAPDPRSRPIIFRASVLAAPPGTVTARSSQRACRIHFDIPAVELQQTVANGRGSSVVGVAVVALNQAGQPIGHVSQKVTLDFDEALYRAHPMAALSFDQQIDLPKKQEAYLYAAVWDTVTGRMGTLDVATDCGELAGR